MATQLYTAGNNGDPLDIPLYQSTISLEMIQPLHGLDITVIFKLVKNNFLFLS